MISAIYDLNLAPFKSTFKVWSFGSLHKDSRVSDLGTQPMTESQVLGIGPHLKSPFLGSKQISGVSELASHVSSNERFS